MDKSSNRTCMHCFTCRGSCRCGFPPAPAAAVAPKVLDAPRGGLPPAASPAESTISSAAQEPSGRLAPAFARATAGLQRGALRPPKPRQRRGEGGGLLNVSPAFGGAHSAGNRLPEGFLGREAAFKAVLSNEKLKSARGFSLVGVLVATALLVVAAIALAQLIPRSQQLSRHARNSFVASSLAREGIELVQVTRDSNWFQQSGGSWTGNLCPDDKDQWDTAIDVDITRSHQSPIEITGPTAGALYRIPDGEPFAGEWTHQPTATNIETTFRRVIHLDCEFRDGDSSQNDAAYITVTSTVTWIDRGQQKQLVLKSTLYDWLAVNTTL